MLILLEDEQYVAQRRTVSCIDISRVPWRDGETVHRYF